MNDSDQSSAAATGPHHPSGDQNKTPAKRQSLFARVRNLLTNRSENLRSDLQNALQHASIKGEDFTDGERAMLTNVLKLSEMRVEDVMVPRADIESVEDEESLGEALNLLRDVGHSRLPVYQENLDNIVGMIHIKDIVERMTEPVEKPSGSPVRLVSAVLKQKVKSQNFLRQVLFVPPSMPVTDLLQTMQARRIHMAIVVDEYGGTDGLVTIEDLLEAVVGDIEDEHDDEETALVRKESDHIFRADARVPLDELQEIIGPDFDASAFSEEADTLGGLVFSLIDRVPVKGEVVSGLKGFDFEILQADPRRVKRVRIVRRTRTQRKRALQQAGTTDPTAKPAPATPDQAAE